MTQREYVRFSSVILHRPTRLESRLKFRGDGVPDVPPGAPETAVLNIRGWGTD